MEQLSGVVERITFSNEQSGFAVVKIKSKGFPDLVTLVGTLATVRVGSTIRVSGEWRMDTKFGRQFAAASFEETVPATLAGLEKYLGSGLIKGIGPKFAKLIVRTFRNDTLQVLDERPEDLHRVPGIGDKRVSMIRKAWLEQQEIKNLMLFLQDHDVSTHYAGKIYKTYGNAAIQTVRENPYRLADDIWGSASGRRTPSQKSWAWTRFPTRGAGPASCMSSTSCPARDTAM
jgi:exodeoxyribonuclease V alpha subunit